MIAAMVALPGWLLTHPWSAAGLVVAFLAVLTSLILVNPNGRQLFRRK